VSHLTTLSIKIDRELKAEADRLFNDMGMNLSTAVNVFVRQAVLQQGIPFAIHRAPLEAKSRASANQRQQALQEIRALLSEVDSSDINLEQLRRERRAVKYERPD